MTNTPKPKQRNGKSWPVRILDWVLGNALYLAMAVIIAAAGIAVYQGALYSAQTFGFHGLGAQAFAALPDALMVVCMGWQRRRGITPEQRLVAQEWMRHALKFSVLTNMISALLIILLLIVGVAVTRSRAGLALLVPALLGSLVIVWQRNAVGAQNKMILVVGGVMAVAIAAAAQFVLTVIVPRFDAMRESEVRFEAWPDVIRAASAVQPWGAGVGSFDPIYRSIERLDIMTAAFLNHAHNDYLEIWLEAGVFGALLLAAFLAWWWSVTIKAWRSSEKNRSSSLRRAASLVVGLLLVHSIFDYPLRTPLLAMVFALACACLVVHREEGGSPIRRQRSRAFSAPDDRGE